MVKRGEEELVTDRRSAPMVLARFMSKVRVEPSGCWLWLAAVNRVTGYGVFKGATKAVNAHRFAYEAFQGPVPEGLQLDHVCRVKRCVNPAHLEVVTASVNTWRHFSLTTHCSEGHPFSGSNLRTTPKGHRRCRACERAWNTTARQKRRAAKKEVARG